MIKKQRNVELEERSQMLFMSLSELCDTCRVSTDFVHHLVEYEIIQPITSPSTEWIFDLMQVKRVKTVIHLQHDLNFNLAAAAMVIDLLEEVQTLRAQMDALEKHFI